MRSSPVFPDCSICKTRHKFGNLWECLADHSYRCPYMLIFGTRNYCRHHQCHSFEKSGRKRTDELM